MKKLIINQNKLLRTPIYIKEKETNCSNKAHHVPHQENISHLNPRT
jgi:hypothetical protein